MTTISVKNLSLEHTNDMIAHYINLSQEDKQARFMYRASEENITNYVKGLDKINFSSGRVFGAFYSGGDFKVNPILIGVAHLAIVDDKVVEISLSVDSRYRRLGCGSMLMNQLITRTQEIGYSKVKLSCLSINRAMVTLAIKTGFTMKSTDRSTSEGFLDLSHFKQKSLIIANN